MPSTSPSGLPETGNTSSVLARQIEGRESWLWGFAVTVTVALTAGIVFLTFFDDHAAVTAAGARYWSDLRDWRHSYCYSIYTQSFSTFSFARFAKNSLNVTSYFNSSLRMLPT